MVGLVLALGATLWKVCGADRYDDESREGEGEGGDVGGMGRVDASSSASRGLEGDHIENAAMDDRWVDASS